MIRRAAALMALLLWAISARAQSKLSVRWEELSAVDFRAAIAQAQGSCLLPFGILEKHGLRLPFGHRPSIKSTAPLEQLEPLWAQENPSYRSDQLS